MTIKPNKQLAIYAEAARNEFGWMADVQHVKLIIVQPKINHVSEHSLTVPELLSFIDTDVRAKAEETRTNPQFNPTDENCFFCKARLECKAREQAVLDTVLGEFDDLDTATPRVVSEVELGTVYAKLDLIKQWCADIAEKVMRKLSGGEVVRRADGLAYKLVEGDKGDRKWDNPDEIEALLKKMRLKDEQMYSMKLISPAGAEKLAATKRTKKGETPVPSVIGPGQWKSLQEHITREAGKPTIVLETDQRKPLGSEDEFKNLEPVAAVPADADLFS